MRVAVLAASDTRASHILKTLSFDERFSVSRVAGDIRLQSFDVLVADSLAPDDLAVEGPPVVLIEELPADKGRDTSNLFAGRIHASLPPDCTDQELAASVAAAALELTVLTDRQARLLLRRRTRATVDFPVEALTPRELQVLRMMADGLGNKEIAGHLEISGHTAKFHVAQILAKLRAGSRAEAVALGIRRGLVPI